MKNFEENFKGFWFCLKSLMRCLIGFLAMVVSIENLLGSMATHYISLANSDLPSTRNKIAKDLQKPRY